MTQASEAKHPLHEPNDDHASTAALRALGSVEARRAVLGRAWVGWVSLTALPILGTVLVMIALPFGQPVRMGASAWFFLILTVCWLVLVIPGVYILRGHCFRATWRGRPIEPASYLRGMTSVWAVLEVGCLLSLAGVVAAGGLLPCAIPGMMAFMLLAFAVPSGRAMGLVAHP